MADYILGTMANSRRMQPIFILRPESYTFAPYLFTAWFTQNRSILGSMSRFMDCCKAWEG